MSRIYLNDGWKFKEQFELSEKDPGCAEFGWKEVRIPHTVKELPFHYFDEKEYQMISCYRRVLHVDKSYEGKACLLTFEGVAHESELFVNGESVYSHHCGYTAFTVDLAPYLKIDADNVISLQGGMGGTYIKTIGIKGEGSLTIEAPDRDKLTIDVTVFPNHCRCLQ